MYEHSLVHPGNLTKLDAAFFMMNGMLSITLLFFVLAERIRPLLLLGWSR
jgi:4-hydroxybenzoate polyprenyltransferase